MAPPYRVPVWTSLAQQVSLRIGLLENSARLAKDTAANRGQDWRRHEVRGAEVVEYGTVVARRGEARHYGLVDPRALRDVARADAVLLSGWDSPAYWQLLAHARLLGRGTVGFYESTLASQSRSEGALARARAVFFRQLDQVIVPGVAAQEAILAMGVAPERIRVGFNAVDSRRFADAPAAAPHPGHRFLVISQLIDRKNVAGALRAFATIAGIDDRLTVIGRGPERDVLGHLADDLAVGDRVDFVDYVPNAELPGVMAEHDTLVLSSFLEVWGLVVNEALASGMQAVVTRQCGVAPSVDGMPGVFLSGDSPAELADTMQRASREWAGRIPSPPILEHTPERLAEVCAEAFHRAIRAHRKGAVQ